MEKQICGKCYGLPNECECRARHAALKLNAGEHPAFTVEAVAGDFATRQALRVGNVADVFMGILIVWLVGKTSGTVMPLPLVQYEALSEDVRAVFDRIGSLPAALKRRDEIIAECRGVN